MMQATTSQAPPAKAVPQAPASPQAVEKSVEQAVNDAIRTAQQEGLSRSERSRVIRDQIRSTIEQIRAQAAARSRDATPVVAQGPFFAPDVIPPQVVDIVMSFFLTVAVIAIGVPLARAFGRRIDRRGLAQAQSQDVTPRLDRIEQAIDAVAIEVERISEGQRFTTRLMSEMRGLPASSSLENWPGGKVRSSEPVPAPANERRG